MSVVSTDATSWLNAAWRTSPIPRTRANGNTSSALLRLKHFAFWSVATLSLLVLPPSSRASTPTSVRLGGGATPWAGRVEVLYEKQWGTICDNGWDIRDANVTCRQLGFTLAVAVTTMSVYGGADDDVIVWVEGVECEGGESDIGDCVNMGDWGVVSSDCDNHTRDAGVICADTANVLNVRLVGGDSVTEGRVEVLFGDEWGGVCDDGWGDDESTVLCRQLGFEMASDNQPSGGEFGEGVGLIWLDDVVCGGDEERLSDCRHSDWGEHNCIPSENVGVRCATADTTNCSVRISTGSYLDRPWAGTVELFSNDEWGRVCSGTWDASDADVVCRQIGYYGALEATFHPLSELHWLSGVECVGSENVLCDCPSNGVANSNCNSMGDAGVTCKVVPGNAYDLRLVGGAYEWEGRVDVSVNGEWGTVCSLDVTSYDTGVICRQLGYHTPLLIYFVSIFGEGEGVLWFDNFNCSGTEDSIFNCPRGGTIGQISASCSHTFDLSVICQAEPISADEVVPVRLVGGATQYEGRVEVLFNGRWGWVCRDGWDMAAAAVTCSQLGYGMAVSYSVGEFEGNLNDLNLFWLDDVICNGTETFLSACSHSMWAQHDCSPLSDAVGVVCSEPDIDPHDVRLMGGLVENSGRVEIYYGGVWGTICGVGWDIDDANVVCRQLGYRGAQVLLGNGMFDEGSGVVWLEGISCHGNESRLVECGLSGWGESECDHGQDSGVLCQGEVMETEVFSIHLTSSPVLPSSHLTSPPTPLTSLLVTSSPLPLSPSSNQHSPLTLHATTTVSMATGRITSSDIDDSGSSFVTTTTTTQTIKATPTNDLSTSASNGGVLVVGIVAGIVAGTILLSLAGILPIIIYKARSCRRQQVYDTAGMSIRPQEGSAHSLSFTSSNNHTDHDETDDGIAVLPNTYSTHPRLNAQFENPHTEMPPDLTPVAMLTPSSRAISSSAMEIHFLENPSLSTSNTSDNTSMATFV